MGAALDPENEHDNEQCRELGEEEHPDRYIINIRVYLRIEFRSLRSDSHTFCDSKHSIC